MSSAAQIQANQENSQLSTGPRTEEGKRISSRNAVRHGILARVLPPEKDDYQQLIHGLYQTFRPQDEFQRTLVDQIAVATIRLRRIYQAEIDVVDKPRQFRKTITQYRADGTQEILEELAPPPLADFLKSEATRNLVRYEAMCQRQIQRNVDLLAKLRGHWMYKGFHKRDCPYLQPESEEPYSPPTDPSDPSDTPTTRVPGIPPVSEHETQPFDPATLSLPEILAHARQQRLRETAELNAVAGGRRRNRNRRDPNPHIGFVSQNQQIRNPPQPPDSGIREISGQAFPNTRDPATATGPKERESPNT